MRTILLVILSLCLVSCGTPLRSEPLPTPVSVSVAYPLFLQPSADRVIECAIQQHPMSLFLTSLPAAQVNLPGPLLQLQLGGAIPGGSNAYQIGEEEISFIVNPENPTTQLSTDQLLAIYSGKQLHWDFGKHPFIEFVSYPAEDTLRTLVKSTLPGMPRISFRAEIVSSPRVILDTVIYHTEAIGYLPNSWLNNLNDVMEGQVKVITLEPSLTESLTQPVLAIANEPLSPELQLLLGCLQQPED